MFGRKLSLCYIERLSSALNQRSCSFLDNHLVDLFCYRIGVKYDTKIPHLALICNTQRSKAVGISFNQMKEDDIKLNFAHRVEPT